VSLFIILVNEIVVLLPIVLSHAELLHKQAKKVHEQQQITHSTLKGGQ